MLNETLYTDQELIAQMALDSEDAFEKLFQRHWERLYLAACRKLDDREMAKEVVHDVFLDLWKRRSELSVTHLPAYLGKAVQYRIINKLVSKKDLFFFEILENSGASLYEADQKLLAKDLTDLIECWVQTLPERRREVFVRYYFQHLTTREIADELQISAKTVQNQLSLSIQFLRARFGHLLTVAIILEEISRSK